MYNQVFLHCAAKNASKNVLWQRADGGHVPEDAHIKMGILTLPNVTRESSGIYRCHVEDYNGAPSSDDVDLKVVELVPVFDGSGYLQLPPLSNEQFENVELKIYFKPKSDNGLLIYTDKISPGGNVNNFHSAGVKDGKFLYTYDIGHGTEILESPNEIMLNEWNNVLIKNTEDSASLELNGGELVYKVHEAPSIVEFDSVSMDLGGTNKLDQKYMTNMSKNYKGIVGSVVIDGEAADLGAGVRVGEVEQYDACAYKPCQHGGHCIPANINFGFICQCDIHYQGEYCEKKSHFCGQEDCNSGICVENPEEGSWQCVCPVGTSGLFCEQDEQIPEVLSFSGDNAFIALPPPPQIQNFSVEMKLIPNEALNNSMLMHLATSYDPTQKGYLNLGVVDNMIVYTYENGAGKNTIQSVSSLVPGRENTIELLRTGDKTTLIVNGEHAKPIHSTSFRPGTDLYIGGLAPGIPKNPKVSQEPFRGCLSEVVVNGKPIDFRETEKYGSGDLTQCTSISMKMEGDEDEENIPIYPVQVPDDSLEEIVDGKANEVATTDEGTIEPTKYPEYEEFKSEEYTPETPLELPTDPPGTVDGKEIVVPPAEVSESEPEKNTTIDRTEDLEHTPYSPETVEVEDVHSTEAPEPAIEQDDDYFTAPPTETEEVNIYESNKDPEPSEIVDFVRPYPTEGTFDEDIDEEEEEDEHAYVLPRENEPEQELPEEITTPPSENTEQYPTIGPDFELEEAPPTAAPSDYYEEESSIPHVLTPDDIVPPCPKGGCPWPDLCTNHSCGVNGVCRQYNYTHFECQCKIYYDGPQCDIFKPIEHAAKFNGDAFIEISGDDFPHLTSEKDEKIEFKFKTKNMNGVIFWQGQTPQQTIEGEDFISIGLKDGFVHYTYELGGGAALMVSKFRVDDGLEHKVRAERRGRDGALYVDDMEPVNGTSSGILAMLNVDGNVYIGGLPDLDMMTSGMHEHNFDGCVADVILNGDKMDLMGSAIDGRNVRPCDEWLQPKRFLKTRRRTRVRARTVFKL